MASFWTHPTVVFYSSLAGAAPLLSYEEELTASPEEIVRRNLRLVLSIVAERYCRDGEVFLDRVQNGNLGLIEAAHTYDRARGVPFAKYARNYILTAIRRGEQDGLGGSAENRIHEKRFDALPDVDTGQPDETFGFLDAEELTPSDVVVRMSRALPEKKRKVILATLEGYTGQETAEKLGISHVYAAKLKKEACQEMQARYAG